MLFGGNPSCYEEADWRSLGAQKTLLVEKCIHLVLGNKSSGRHLLSGCLRWILLILSIPLRSPHHVLRMFFSERRGCNFRSGSFLAWVGKENCEECLHGVDWKFTEAHYQTNWRLFDKQITGKRYFYSINRFVFQLKRRDLEVRWECYSEVQ